jgi:hypothetical protein
LTKRVSYKEIPIDADDVPDADHEEEVHEEEREEVEQEEEEENVPQQQSDHVEQEEENEEDVGGDAEDDVGAGAADEDGALRSGRTSLLDKAILSLTTVTSAPRCNRSRIGNVHASSRRTPSWTVFGQAPWTRRLWRRPGQSSRTKAHGW